MRPIGLIEAGCLILYVIPTTSGAGAVLLTGYLGGAVASQLRAGAPLWTHTFFPVYVGALVWAGLLLRDERVRRLLLPRLSGSVDPQIIGSRTRSSV